MSEPIDMIDETQPPEMLRPLHFLIRRKLVTMPAPSTLPSP